MKKGLRYISLVLGLTLLFLTLPQRAEAASASLSGNSTAQPGSSITLKLNISGSNIMGITAKLNYDSSVMEFTDYSLLVNGWSREVNGTLFLMYGVSNPISSAAVLSVTFKVKSSAAVGTALSASFSDITVSDGGGDTNLSNASWSGTVSAAPSSVCDLSTLSCSNATLSPAFSAATTYYTATVPFSVEKLNLGYTAKDKDAKISVSGNSLVVGVNTITVTCTAPNGAKKNYTISVTRQQDPNYKASTDAFLSALTLDAGALSPLFAPGVTDYVVYVPFETKEVKLTGVARDEKAMRVSEDSRTLASEGDTTLSVTCTAEDGITIKTYTVHVYRMPLYEGVLPLVTATDLSTETDVKTLILPATLQLPLLGETPLRTAVIIGTAFLAAILLLIGFLLGRIGRGWDNDEPEDRERRQPPKLPPAPERPLPPRQEKTGIPREHASPERGHTAHGRDTHVSAQHPKSEPQPHSEHRGETQRPHSELFDDAKALFEETSRPSAKAAEPVKPAPLPKSEKPEPAKQGEDAVNAMSLDELLDDIRRL